MAKRAPKDNEDGSPAAGAAPAHHGVPLPMLIGIVLGVALLVGGGSVAAIMFLKPSDPPSTEEELLAEGEHGLDEEHGPLVGAAYLEIPDPFIVNLQPDETFPYSYLKFAVSLEVADAHAADGLQAKLPKIKAIINGLMNNVPYTDLSTEKGQKKYTDKIVNELNEALESHGDDPKAKAEDHGPPVYAAYFTTLVAQ